MAQGQRGGISRTQNQHQSRVKSHFTKGGLRGILLLHRYTLKVAPFLTTPSQTIHIYIFKSANFAHFYDNRQQISPKF